ncbi:MAG: DNA adenine methylase [Vicinamibacterales bacterium]
MKPFLKWAGGKRQLLPQLREFYPAAPGAYFEPFVGSGAVFFDLWNGRYLAGRRVTLSDENADLIGCYLRLRDARDEVMTALALLADGHEQRGPEHFYDVRDARFNPAREAWQDESGRANDYSASLAAMLIYLNRTGYNGLFRLNARGRFNVPVGRYDHPRIVDGPALNAVADVLATPRITIEEAPFEHVADVARAGDLVYFDPPYAPLSATASFRSYTARGFGDEDQRRLQALVIALAKRNVNVLLSNSVAPSVVDLYERDAAMRQAGLHVYRIPARRAINSKAERRGSIEELLVTNLPRRTCRQPGAASPSVE